MRWIWGCAVFAAASVLGGLGAAGAAPLEVYGRLPTLDHVEISPDGANLAFVITTPEAHRVVIESIADRKLLGGVNLGDAKLRWLDWADSQRLLITTSMTGLAAGVESSRQEWYLAQVFDLASKRSRAASKTAVSPGSPSFNPEAAAMPLAVRILLPSTVIESMRKVRVCALPTTAKSNK